MAKKSKNLKFDDCADCQRHGSFWCTRCEDGEHFEEKDRSVRMDNPWQALREWGYEDE